MKIPVSSIAIRARQRQRMDESKLRDLADSIKARGRLIHPINVRPTRPDDTYDTGDRQGQPIQEPWVLLTGGRRYAAHFMLGWSEIEARNYDDISPLEQQVVELEENLIRADITWDEEVAAKARMHQLKVAINPEHTASDTAQELGMDKGNFSRELQLYKELQANPDLKKSTSKAAAQRKVSFRQEIDKRIASVKAADLSGIKTRLETADMRDYIRRIPSQSVDLVFPDFPFGIDYDLKGDRPHEAMKGGYVDRATSLHDLLDDVVPHIVRVLKPSGWAACMMGWTNYVYLVKAFVGACGTHCGYATVEWNEDKQLWQRTSSSCSSKTRELDSSEPCRFVTPEDMPWIWYRPNSRQPSMWPELHANNQYELICVVNGGSAKLVRPNVPNVLAFDAIYSDRLHEMQRPHELCKEIISRLTVTGELVLDLCFGSGAHLAAAADLAREYRGCDINPDNMGPAMSLIAQFAKSPAVMATLKRPAADE